MVPSLAKPGSPFRDYYVWSVDEPDDPHADQVVFPDRYDSVWSYDAQAKGITSIASMTSNRP